MGMPPIISISLLLVCSSFIVMAVAAGSILESDSNGIHRHSLQSRNGKKNTEQLLRHAIKVDRKYQSRFLDEADDGDGDDNEEDNDNDNEDEEADDEEEEDEDEDEDEDEADDEEEEEEVDEEEEEEAEEEADDAEEEEEGDNDDAAAEEEEEGGNDDEAENNENDDEADEEEEEENDDVEEEGSEDQDPQINFVKCAAFTIEPNIVNVDEMIENGEINDDETAQIENGYVTKMTSKLNTQESIVYFTLGNGQNDDDRELYMININDWIASSYGYDKICTQIDQNDVDMVFSIIPSFSSSSIKQYSEHAWYAGFNCKADGSGFKTQLFLDDTCTTFSPTLNKYYPFKSSTNGNRANQDYSTQVASDLTKYMIQKINNIIENSQYCDESEFCDDVLENSVDLVTCLKNGEEADDDDRRRRRKLASYQLSYDEASNVKDACQSIQAALSIDQYEYTDVEAEEVIVLWSNVKNGGQESDRASGTGLLSTYWYYLAGLLVVGCVITCLILRTKKFGKSREKSSLDSNDNPKSQPFISKSQVKSDEAYVICEDLSAVECQMTNKERRRKSRRSSRSTSRSSRSSRSTSKGRRLRNMKSKSARDAKGPWMSFAVIENDSSKEPPSTTLPLEQDEQFTRN